MCRKSDHGGRRCPHDSSDARQRRRKAQKERESHLPRVAGRGSKVQRYEALSTMDAMRAEAAIVSELLKQAPAGAHYDDDQAAIDAEIEKRVTRLGLALGEEADRRSKFNLEEYNQRREQYHRESDEAFAQAEDYMRRSYRHRSEEAVGMSDRAWKKHEKKMDNLRIEFHTKAWDLLDDEKAYTEAVVLKQSQAYLSVLSDFRELGGTVVPHELSDPEAIASLNDALSRSYPSDWIEASNNSQPFLVLESSSRSHYRAPGPNLYNEQGRAAMHETMMMSEVHLEKYLKSMSKHGDKTVRLLDTQPVVDTEGRNLWFVTGPARYAFDPDTDPVDESGRPLGEGWMFGNVPREDKPFGTKGWYRYKFEEPDEAGRLPSTPALTLPDSRWVMSEFLSEQSRKDSANDMRSTAYHEFTHRVEDVIPHSVLPRLEGAFINRRTTTRKGVQQPLELLYPDQVMEEEEISSVELYRRGGFVLDYVGKHYINSRLKEVMTMGAEMTFTGKYGAFVGIDGHRSDLDHRGFVLGMLATA